MITPVRRFLTHGPAPRRYGITGARERRREVQQQTELALLQYSH